MNDGGPNDSLVGQVGYVSLPIPVDGPGEVMLSVRGGTEAFGAWSEEPIADADATAINARADALQGENQALIAANKLIDMLPELVSASAHGIEGANLTVLNGSPAWARWPAPSRRRVLPSTTHCAARSPRQPTAQRRPRTTRASNSNPPRPGAALQDGSAELGESGEVVISEGPAWRAGPMNPLRALRLRLVPVRGRERPRHGRDAHAGAPARCPRR